MVRTLDIRPDPESTRMHSVRQLIMKVRGELNMSIEKLLYKCRDLYNQLPCCHTDRTNCNCRVCWHDEFFHSIPETYDCLKKLCCYVLYYGPAYITEIYHYLNKSQLLEKNFDGRHIQVLSLGCGFGPDAYALEKYIEDNNLDISFTYTGYDVAEKWADIRENYPNRSFEVRDLLSGFSLENYDIMLMNEYVAKN